MTLVFYELIDLKLNKENPKGKQRKHLMPYEKLTNTEISIATFWKITSEIASQKTDKYAKSD